jgi:ferredoxin
MVHGFSQWTNPNVEHLICKFGCVFLVMVLPYFYFENMTGSISLSSEPAATVPITYIEADGTERIVQAKVGSNLLDTAHDNGVELEGTKGFWYWQCTTAAVGCGFDTSITLWYFVCCLSLTLGFQYLLGRAPLNKCLIRRCQPWIIFGTFSTLFACLGDWKIGACGGELACSTCHLVFEKEVFDSLPAMKEEEEDMLDLAMELTDTYVAQWMSTRFWEIFFRKQNLSCFLSLVGLPLVCFAIMPHRSRLGCQIIVKAEHAGITVSDWSCTAYSLLMKSTREGIERAGMRAR